MAEAVVAFVKVATWVFTSKTLAAVVVRTVVLAGMSALSSKLAARNAAKGNTAAAGVEQQRQGGALVRRAIALGPCVVFGSELDLIASGNGDDNRTNWRALAVSDWPCRAGRIWVNAQPLTFAGDINAGWQACDQYRAKSGQPRLWMRFLTGAFDQATDAELLATGLWSSDDRLRGVAALLIKRQYDADAFPNGPPDGNDLRIEVMDAPVFDWRDNTQSLTDVTTWKPSTNPVVLAEFILCHARAPAQFNPGTTAPIVGPGLKWARRGGRDTFRAQLTTYANLCDALVGGVPRYRAALVVRSDQTGEEVMQLLADACGGDWVSGPAGGMLVPGHVPAPVRTIPVGEYAAGQPLSFDPYEAPDQAVNTLNITGPDLDRAGELDTMTVSDIDDVLADGGERAQGLDLSAVPWAEQRWRVGWRKYRLARLSERRQIPVRARHRDLIPGDVIVAPDATLPTTPVDMSAAWWQVTGAQESVREDGHWVALTLQRVAASVDGPVPERGATADFDPPPLAPELAVPVIAVAAAPEVAGTAITPRWRITLDEAGVQTRARVMVQGPAATAGAIGSATQTIVDVTRGVPVFVPSGPGWWRWRASGLDAAGRQGPWGSWSSAVQEMQEVVSAVAAAVDWPAVRDTNPTRPRPEDGATRGAIVGETLFAPGGGSTPLPGTEVLNSALVPVIDAVAGTVDTLRTAASDPNLMVNGLWSRGKASWLNVSDPRWAVALEPIHLRPMLTSSDAASITRDEFIVAEIVVPPRAAVYAVQYQGQLLRAGSASTLSFYLERRRASDGVWEFTGFAEGLPENDLALRQRQLSLAAGYDRLRVVWNPAQRPGNTGPVVFRLGPVMITEWVGGYPPLNDGLALSATVADLASTAAALNTLENTVAGMLDPPSVSVDNYNPAASGTTNITTSTVTASMGGASGAVTYDWLRLSGPTSHVALSPSAAATEFRRTGTIPAGATEESSWQVRAVDAAGRTVTTALRVEFNSTA